MDELKTWGYTGNEATFLNIVASCGGYFVASQYNRFRGVKPGKAVHQLTSKGIRKGHIRARRIGSRVLYRWLGVPPELAVKVADVTVQRRLIRLDFVISHWHKFRFLPDTAEKGYSFEEASIPGFCFIEHGRSFDGWLEHYKQVLASLGKVILVYVSPHKRRITAAKKRIEAWTARMQDAEQMALLRSLKVRFEDAKERASMTPDEVVMYRNLLAQYSTTDGMPPGTSVVFRDWWEPGLNKHFTLFELPTYRTPA